MVTIGLQWLIVLVVVVDARLVIVVFIEGNGASGSNMVLVNEAIHDASNSGNIVVVAR